MNYRTTKKSKFHLLVSAIIKNNTHDKVSKDSLNFSKYFNKIWRFISKALFNNSEYIYDKNTFYSKSCNTCYTVENPIDIQLMSSIRTFL
ncbi:hypothetical protein [Clostridium weizhouense]|uniref:Transposase n=1 Tax=Clostridium weizhouense TaxID=2859781 RepID=A0ABS7APM8_9CLOT|nr:hypothetical protein [Clostridium weizhouense]MBW6410616.1 hypothetical protein [Clostridium weizhouense]